MHDLDSRERMLAYFRRLESRWVYSVLLDDTRHFGYYPPGRERIPVATALALMEDRLAEALALDEGALVLDAGCGRGNVARHLATSFGLRVEGIDVQAGDIRRATASAAAHGTADRTRFQVMDYSRLDFPDAHFAGVYTMETLVFAPDCAHALAGFHRVLEPGGRLALFEYSVPAREDMTDVERRLFDEVVADTAMDSLPGFVHGGFPALLREAGFEDVTVEDLTERMLPMVRWLARLLWLPYQLGRPLGLRRRMVNALATIEAARRPGRWRYNAVTATKPA